MTTDDPTKTATTETAREGAAFSHRVSRTNQLIMLGVAALFAMMGVLPITQEENRAGVLWTALLITIVALISARMVPSAAMGGRRLLVFGIVVQPIGIVLLSLTGGNASPYFPYFVFPVLGSVFAPRTAHTLILGAVTAASLLIVALLASGVDPPAVVAGRLVTQLIELIAYVLFTAFAGRALRDARRAITARAEALAGERTSALELAFTDTLSGLYNRRYADDLMKRLVLEAARGRPFSVVALDLDGLKRINDSLGHATGDRVIARIGEILRLQLRGADVPIRLGGDEFLALLPGTREAQAKAVGERLRAAVKDDDWSAIGMPISISAGAAEWRSGQSSGDVVKAADAALYQVKHARASA